MVVGGLGRLAHMKVSGTLHIDVPSVCVRYRSWTKSLRPLSIAISACRIVVYLWDCNLYCTRSTLGVRPQSPWTRSSQSKNRFGQSSEKISNLKIDLKSIFSFGTYRVCILNLVASSSGSIVILSSNGFPHHSEYGFTLVVLCPLDRVRCDRSAYLIVKIKRAQNWGGGHSP